MRALIYDSAILPLTASLYRQVLERLDEGAHLLDVGIGTGGALGRNERLVLDKHLRVTGVDIDEDYVQRCRARMEKKGLSRVVEVRLESIYDHQGGPYDAAYFSSSFMLMPEPQRALQHVLGLLRPGATVYFTQTFQERRSKLMEKAKPLLGKLTTIEFGTVTYEADFLAVLQTADLEVVEMEVLSRTPTTSNRIVAAHPR